MRLQNSSKTIEYESIEKQKRPDLKIDPGELIVSNISFIFELVQFRSLTEK